MAAEIADPAQPAQRRLLLLGCSRQKRHSAEVLPALQRYDGPAFRVLRKALREGAAEGVDVLVLSAHYGCIATEMPIADYNLRMTHERALALAPGVTETLADHLARGSVSEAFVLAGRDYLVAFQGALDVLRTRATVRVASGSQGGRLAQLRAWLRGEHDAAMTRPQTRVTGQGRLRGSIVNLTPEQVFAAARRALRDQPHGAQRFQSWCVQVDGTRVAPKWLASVLTGQPVGRFTTDQARVLLGRLGVAVWHV